MKCRYFWDLTTALTSAESTSIDAPILENVRRCFKGKPIRRTSHALTGSMAMHEAAATVGAPGCRGMALQDCLPDFCSGGYTGCLGIISASAMNPCDCGVTVKGC